MAKKNTSKKNKTKKNKTKKDTTKKDRIYKDKAFERTRENMSEFGRAGEANKLVRQAISELRGMSDRYVSGRLTKRMLRIVQSDPVRGRGDRIVTPEALPMLEGFNFNRDKSLADTLYTPWYLYLDHTAGLFRIHLPFFNAITMVDTQSDASEYNFIACATAIDFEKQDLLTVTQQSPIIQTNDTTTKSVNLTLNLPPGNPHPVILTLGVQTNGMHIPAGTETPRPANALAVIKVVTG